MAEQKPFEPTEAAKVAAFSTAQHIFEVQNMLFNIIQAALDQSLNESSWVYTTIAQELLLRAKNHDKSKLSEKEIELFGVYTPMLKHLTFNSPEYKDTLAGLKPALDNHYAENSHHPEHFSSGINDMTLFDVIEMLCDWKAAALRSKNGNVNRSIVELQERFGYSDDLAEYFREFVMRIDTSPLESHLFQDLVQCFLLKTNSGKFKQLYANTRQYIVSRRASWT